MQRTEPVPQSGQAQIEFLAVLPLLAAAGLVLLQLLLIGEAQSLVDGSAAAGAVALTAGASADRAARAALPGWAGARLGVDVDGGRVRVQLRPRTLLPGLGSRLDVSSTAFVRSPGAGP